MTLAQTRSAQNVGLLALAVAIASAGCAATPQTEDAPGAVPAAATAPTQTRTSSATPGPVLDALIGSTRVRLSFDALADRVELAPDSDFRAVLLGRDEQHSHHVVAIRRAEQPHRHDEHDLLVVMLEGHGEMLIGQQSKPVGPGSILYIPRRTVHAFRNQSPSPAIAYAIYTPPFDGKDRVAAE